MKTLLPLFCACLLALVFFQGCASTNITSSTDPDYAGKPFKRITVFSDTADLGVRAEVETKFVQDCKDAGYDAVGWLQIYPATRAFSETSRDSVLKANNIDGFLDISFVNSGSTFHRDEGTRDRYGYHEGARYFTPWAKIDAVLYDDANWRKAWVASLTSEESGHSDFSNSFDVLVSSFCQKMQNQLVKDGMLKK